MGKYGKTGVSVDTPKNTLFGAGTIHKNLKYDGLSGKVWNFEESIVGATKGGSKFAIKPEFYNVEPDGAMVPIKGLKRKTKETATMEINFLEITKDLMLAGTNGKVGTSADDKYDVIESKEDIVEGDYWDNIAFVGETLAGKNIIVVMDNALCTSGFAMDNKNNESGGTAFTFECTADLKDGEYTKLPYHIYYPKVIA